LFELRSKVKFDILVKRETVAKVVFWPNCVVLKTKNGKIKIKEEYESCEELLSVIGKTLKEALAKNSDCIH
jgi:Holliday junction resolvase